MADSFGENKKILIVQRVETDRGATELRTMEWNINGKRSRTFEKRDVYMGEGGQEMMGKKPRGLNGADFELITRPEIAAKIKASLLIAPNKPQPGHGGGQTGAEPQSPAEAAQQRQPVPAAEYPDDEAVPF